MKKYIPVKNPATVLLTPQPPDTRDIFIILALYCCVSDFQKGTDLHSCMHNNSVFTVGLRALETLKQSRCLLYGAREGFLWYASPDSKPFRLRMDRSSIVLSDFYQVRPLDRLNNNWLLFEKCSPGVDFYWWLLLATYPREQSCNTLTFNLCRWFAWNVLRL